MNNEICKHCGKPKSEHFYRGWRDPVLHKIVKYYFCNRYGISKFEPITNHTQREHEKISKLDAGTIPMSEKTVPREDLSSKEDIVRKVVDEIFENKVKKYSKTLNIQETKLYTEDCYEIGNKVYDILNKEFRDAVQEFSKKIKSVCGKLSKNDDKMIVGYICLFEKEIFGEDLLK